MLNRRKPGSLQEECAAPHLFLAPKNFGIINHRPFLNSSAIGCGIAADAAGYATCSIGGTIDSVREKNLRTRGLKDLFDPEFAHRPSYRRRTWPH